MSKNYYISGEWNLACDVCSKKIKAHEAHHRWDGLLVCKDDFEQRHPQDFVRARQDKITVPFSRPITELIFTNPPVCTQWSIQGIANQGTADCAQADLDQDLQWFPDWIQTYCTIDGQSAISDLAIAGCVIAGKYIQGRL